MSNRCAKKIIAAAQVEGESAQCFTICDLDESTGSPKAMLFWPTSDDPRHVWQELEASGLSPSSDEGVNYVYTGEPIRIPKVLEEIRLRAEPLSDDGIRLGYFRIDSR